MSLLDTLPRPGAVERFLADMAGYADRLSERALIERMAPTLSRTTADLAIERAMRWVEAARPAIHTAAALERMMDDLAGDEARTSRDARTALTRAYRELLDDLESARDDAIGAVEPRFVATGDDDADEAAWSAFEDEREEIARGVPTVDAAVRRLEREAARG